MHNNTSSRATRTRTRRSRISSFSRPYGDFSDDSLDTINTTYDDGDADIDIGSTAGSVNPSNSPVASPQEGPRKRTPHACDNCRVKKTRCTGETPCALCRKGGLICQYLEGDSSVAKTNYSPEELSIFFQKLENLERGLRLAHYHLGRGGIPGYPIEFSDLLPWLERNTPNGSFQSRDVGLRAQSTQSKKKIRTRTRRAPLSSLFKPDSAPVPAELFKHPNDTASPNGPILQPCTRDRTQLDLMTEDGTWALVDLAYLVQASNPPPIVPFHHTRNTANDGNVHRDDYTITNNTTLNSDFFTGRYSPQENQFAGVSEYGQPNPFDSSYGFQYPQNTSDPSQSYQYQPTEYHQLYHQPQMSTHHGQGSDNGNNASNSHSFYPH